MYQVVIYSIYAEENIPTKEIKKSQKTWFYGPNVYLRRAESLEKKKKPRQGQSYSLMLPKLKRLNLKKDFKKVASGKKIESGLLTLFVRNGDDQNPRVGIALSGKTFKKAHERNRARRLVSAAFETLYSRLPPTINIVALPKAGVLDVKSQEVLVQLEQVLKNEKIIN